MSNRPCLLLARAATAGETWGWLGAQRDETRLTQSDRSSHSTCPLRLTLHHDGDLTPRVDVTDTKSAQTYLASLANCRRVSFSASASSAVCFQYRFVLYCTLLFASLHYAAGSALQPKVSALTAVELTIACLL